MTDQENDSKIHLSSTSLLAFLTLLIAVIAAIPGFLSLNEEHAEVFYSTNTSHVSIPDSLDTKKALSLLESYGIPGSTVELSIINQGNSEADAIKISLKTPGKIIDVWSKPTRIEKPIWVSLPEIKIDSDSNQFQTVITKMGTTFPVTYFVGYLHSDSEDLDVKVFHDGKPAMLVENVSSVSKWSKWKIFELPLLILVGGLGIVLVWVFVVALYKSPSFRDKVISELVEAMHPGYGPIGVSILIQKALKLTKKK